MLPATPSRTSEPTRTDLPDTQGDRKIANGETDHTRPWIIADDTVPGDSLKSGGVEMFVTTSQSWIPPLVVVMIAIPAVAQSQIFKDGFEWGDTGDWSVTVPARCDAISPFSRGIAPTVDLHVAENGNDISGDGSMGRPFATIGRAAIDAAPGTAIRVHAGTYDGGTYISDLAGEPSAPIWIGGVPGEARPLIQGGGEGMHLTRVRHVVVHDLEVTGASFNGINCDDGGDYDNPSATHHVVFRDLNIHDIGSDGNQDCLKLSGVNDYWVLNSSFARCGGGFSGSGVDHVGCHDGLLARNLFQDLSGNAIQSKGGSENIEIRWNHFSESGQRSLNMGGSTGFSYFRPSLSTTSPNAEARDIRVVSNFIEGSQAAVAYVGCVGCVVVNNTIVDPHNWILRILQESTTTGDYEFEACGTGVFINNLVYFERSDLSTYVNIGPDTAPGTFTFANNLWYARDSPAQSQPTLPVSETNGIYGLDPGLDSAYRVAPTGPAAGAGALSAWTWGDLGGACYGNPPTIGAFEAR